MDNCIFCKIAKKQIPSHVIYEDEKIIAILDIHPIRKGHVLVNPKEHYRVFYEMPEDIGAHLFNVSQRLAKVLQSELEPERVGVVLTGNDVPHVHLHLIPMHEKTDITSSQYVKIKDGEIAYESTPLADSESLQQLAKQLNEAAKNA